MSAVRLRMHTITPLSHAVPPIPWRGGPPDAPYDIELEAGAETEVGRPSRRRSVECPHRAQFERHSAGICTNAEPDAADQVALQTHCWKAPFRERTNIS